jgi:hypothetical protein
VQTPLMSLWLPVLVSGVALFFASFVAWMILPHHKAEWKGLPSEDAVIGALRSAAVPPGQYHFPYAKSPADMKAEEFQSKVKVGPRGTMTLWAAPPNMGANMVCTVLFFLVANFVIAYLAGMVIQAGADRWFVFRFAGTAGILTYGTANILNGIWFGRKMVADIVDGIAYGLITGAIFAWMWPAAV